MFDEDADWVPQIGRHFKIKTGPLIEEPKGEEPTKEEPPFRMKAEPPDIKYDLSEKQPKTNKKEDTTK